MNKVAPAHPVAEGSNIQTQPSKFHKVIQHFDVLFRVASITTFGFIFVGSCGSSSWPPVFTFSDKTWNYKEIHDAGKSRWCGVEKNKLVADNHALCPDESDWWIQIWLPWQPSHTTPSSLHIPGVPPRVLVLRALRIFIFQMMIQAHPRNGTIGFENFETLLDQLARTQMIFNLWDLARSVRV